MQDLSHHILSNEDDRVNDEEDELEIQSSLPQFDHEVPGQDVPPLKKKRVRKNLSIATYNGNSWARI